MAQLADEAQPGVMGGRLRAFQQAQVADQQHRRAGGRHPPRPFGRQRAVAALFFQPVAPGIQRPVVDDAQRDAALAALAQQAIGQTMHVLPVRPQPLAKIQHHHPLRVPGLQTPARQMARQLLPGDLPDQRRNVQPAQPIVGQMAFQGRQQASLGHQVFIIDQSAFGQGFGVVLANRLDRESRRWVRLGGRRLAGVPFGYHVRERHLQREFIGAGRDRGRRVAVRYHHGLGRERRLGTRLLAVGQAVFAGVVQHQQRARRAGQ
ncbi:hypothetical protein BJL95_15430 [Methylomonas sp. LWB]|nr:hypothetical protein BJL95_15430 [Methylomonas sp. LWB]